jgi:hypothetical protein
VSAEEEEKRKIRLARFAPPSSDSVISASRKIINTGAAVANKRAKE